MQNPSRYARQIVLPEIGVSGQAKLAAAKVLCIGAGGLGSPALQYLAGAGIGALGIMDYDRVDISNLHRQTLFADSDAGQSKALAAAKKLAAFNPDISIKAYDEELTDKNAAEIFSRYDVIVDGTDNFAAKFLINDAAVLLGKPFVYGAIEGFEGRVSVFGMAGGPCYRCLYPQPPKAGIRNCAENGVLGALPGIIGATQALEAIKVIAGHAALPPLKGRLWMMDARSMHATTLAIAKRPSCPACANPANIRLQYQPASCGTMEIDWETASTFENAILIDVREMDEWQRGHIPDAQHLALSALQHDPKVFEISDVPCLLYCQRGIRSKAAAEILLGTGHKNIYSVKGGYEAWAQRA